MAAQDEEAVAEARLSTRMRSRGEGSSRGIDWDGKGMGHHVPKNRTCLVPHCCIWDVWEFDWAGPPGDEMIGLEGSK